MYIYIYHIHPHRHWGKTTTTTKVQKCSGKKGVVEPPQEISPDVCGDDRTDHNNSRENVDRTDINQG